MFITLLNYCSNLYIFKSKNLIQMKINNLAQKLGIGSLLACMAMTSPELKHKTFAETLSNKYVTVTQTSGVTDSFLFADLDFADYGTNRDGRLQVVKSTENRVHVYLDVDMQYSCNNEDTPVNPEESSMNGTDVLKRFYARCDDWSQVQETVKALYPQVLGYVNSETCIEDKAELMQPINSGKNPKTTKFIERVLNDI